MKTLPLTLFLIAPAAIFAQSDESQHSELPKPPPARVSTFPEIETVIASMKRATSFFRREVSFAGGYAWKWPTDLSTAQAEAKPTQPGLIAIQPPGTPSVGMAMLEAYRVTEDKLFLQGAREAAQALIWCQMATGGWRSDFHFDPRQSRRLHFRRDIDGGDTERGKRWNGSSLDDEKTQSALLFLLELAHTPACADDPHLRHALDFGFDGLLAAQAPNGGWPQIFEGPADPNLAVSRAKFPATWPREHPDETYSRYYTLNDNNILETIRILLRAYELEQDERFLTSAKKAGDFLLAAQLPEPQPAWAQQYNFDFEPTWARRFEPPGVSSIESFGAMLALHELWIATGDDRFIATLPKAFDWLENRRLPDGRWARFYELETNKPLYCTAETYEVTYDDSNLPTHYGFKIDADFSEDLEELKERLKKTPAELRAEDAEPNSASRWTSFAKGRASRVRDALRSQLDNGSWLRDEMIDTREFVSNFERMSAYVKGATRGGEDFRRMQEKAHAKEPVRIAALVASWVRGEKEANWDRVKGMIREAANHDAQIVCTTECFLDGYAMGDETMPLKKLGEPIPDGKFFKRLAELAAELKIHLVAGMLEADGDKRLNTAIVFGPDGQMIGKAREGDAAIFRTSLGKLGVIIGNEPASPPNAEILVRLGGSKPPTVRKSKRHIISVHPRAFHVIAPDGSIAAKTVLGDEALLAKEKSETADDLRHVFYFDSPRQ